MSQKIKTVSEEAFAEEVKKGKVLVDFYADWCSPCRMMAPVLEKVATKMEAKVKIIQIDIDQAQQISSQFQVTSIPTLILFDGGEEAGRLVGLRDATAIENFINNPS